MKPEGFTDDEMRGFLEYLDDLRKSGVTNMFGATPYLEREFPALSRKEAGDILGYWMETFSDRHPSHWTSSSEIFSNPGIVPS